jgi:hypothetical protein
MPRPGAYRSATVPTRMAAATLSTARYGSHPTWPALIDTILVHEMVHAVAGAGASHGLRFIARMRRAADDTRDQDLAAALRDQVDYYEERTPPAFWWAIRRALRTQRNRRGRETR